MVEIDKECKMAVIHKMEDTKVRSEWLCVCERERMCVCVCVCVCTCVCVVDEFCFVHLEFQKAVDHLGEDFQ